MMFSHGALLRFSLFIDASTSDGSMDGGVNGRGRCWIIHVSLVQLKLFLIIQFFVEFNTSLHYSVFIMNECSPIFFHNRIIWPFPKRCFCLACFRLLLFSMASMICFSSCLRMSSFIFCQIALQISEYSMLSVGVPFLFICLHFSLSCLVPVDSLLGFSLLYLPAIEMAAS